MTAGLGPWDAGAYPATDLTMVSDFLTTDVPGRVASPWANPDPSMLNSARQMYENYSGRLPSPTPPERPEPSHTLRVYVAEFSSDMRAFVDETKDQEATEAFNYASWNDLPGEAARALAALDTHEKRWRNWRNPFEAADRMAGAVARRMEFFLELIPDGDYTSLLVGGLKLLCSTARRKKEIRDKILEALDSLNGTVSHTTAEIRLYSRNQDLRDKSESLYIAIMEFVKMTMRYLRKSSVMESTKAFFKQDRYGADLEGAIGAISSASGAFEKAVSICFQQRVQNIDRNVESLKNPIVAIYSFLAGVLKDFPHQLQQLQAEMHSQSTMQAQSMLQMQMFMQMSAAQAQPTVSAPLLRQLLCTSWHSGQAMTDDLLSTLAADLRTASRHVPPPMDQQRIGLLISDARFAGWLRSLSSQFVVVHDGHALDGNASLSTLSYLVALTTHMLAAPGMTHLPFFCGLHSRPGSMLEGAHGVVRSLALQLLQLFGDMSFPVAVDPGLIQQGLAANDLETLCDVFALALQHVPAGVVYVVVDGAFWYGTSARADDLANVVMFLNQLVCDEQAASRGVVLKVMVTNPAARQRNAWRLDAAADIYLDNTLLTGGHGGDLERLLSE